MKSEKRFYQEAKRLGFIPRRLEYYVFEYLFRGIDLKSKRLLDVGGGVGAYSLAAVLRGAKAVILEPEADGSTSGVNERFASIRESLSLDDDDIRIDKRTLQAFADDDKFDLILLNNSINHLNEAACIKLVDEQWAADAYLQIFQKLASLLNDNGVLIITDCTRRNFWPDIGVVNPFMRSIEWNKHQAPEAWAALLDRVGFKLDGISWSSFNALRDFGRLTLGNRLCSYFILGHFKLVMRLRAG